MPLRYTRAVPEGGRRLGWEETEATIVVPKELITGFWNAMDGRRWYEVAD